MDFHYDYQYRHTTYLVSVHMHANLNLESRLWENKRHAQTDALVQKKDVKATNTSPDFFLTGCKHIITSLQPVEHVRVHIFTV